MASKLRMMSQAIATPTLLLAASIACDANAAGSLLRVACEGPDAGAEVTINGVFKGECPLDIQVNEGVVQLRALKKVDATRERVFEQQFRIGDGVVKKIEVALSAPRLTAEAQRRDNERIAAERAEAARREEARLRAVAEERRADQESLEQQRKAADAGDTSAMLALADRYEAGRGVGKSDGEARSWIQKAANTGNAVAAFRLTNLYKTGNKQDVADIVKMLAFPVEDERNPAVEGDEKVRVFSTTDPFFEVPGGNEKVSYWYEARYAANAIMRSELTCGRNGKYFEVVHKNESPHVSSTGESTGVLGALVWLSSKSSTGLFNSNHHEVTRIDKLGGHPFPLVPGKRFSISYTTRMTGDAKVVSATTLTCGAIGDMTAIPRQGGAQGQPVMCLHQTGTFGMAMRTYWHEPSGCFLIADRK